MKALLKTTVAAIVLGVAASASPFAHAQPMMGFMDGGCMMMGPMGQGMMGQGMMDQGMMGQGMMGQGMMGQGMMDWHPDMDAVVLGRLAYLQAELGITAGQMDAWNAYGESIKDHMAAMGGMHHDMMAMMYQGTMVERLDARISAMEAMADILKAEKPAAEALYAVLDDEQKKKADFLIGMPCGMM